MKRQPAEAETHVIWVRQALEKSPGRSQREWRRIGLGQKSGNSSSISGNGQNGGIALPGGTASELGVGCVDDFMKPHAGNSEREHGVVRVERGRRAGCVAS
jgi:hypothetical protein